MVFAYLHSGSKVDAYRCGKQYRQQHDVNGTEVDLTVKGDPFYLLAPGRTECHPDAFYDALRGDVSRVLLLKMKEYLSIRSIGDGECV